jgi:hypothetical protein
MQALLMPGFSQPERRAVLVSELAARVGSCARGDYLVPGHTVCRTAYLMLRDMSHETLRVYKNAAAEQWDRAVSADSVLSLHMGPHGRSGKTYLSSKATVAVRWIVERAELYGDRSPDSDKIHVSLFLSPTWLHKEFVAWGARQGLHQLLGLRSWLGLFAGHGAGASYVQMVDFARKPTRGKKCSICVAGALKRGEMARRGLTRVNWRGG